MWTGIFIQRRYAHQAHNLEAMDGAAPFHKRHSISRRDASLLRLFTGVDLNKQLQVPPLGFHLRPDGLGDLLPVHRVNYIEQGHRIRRLVGLKGPDKMQFNIVERVAQTGPFALRLLHPVLAKQPLPRLKRRADRLLIKGFRHGNELRRPVITPAARQGCCNFGLNLVQIFANRHGPDPIQLLTAHPISGH